MRVLYIITKSEAGGAQTHVSQMSRYVCTEGGAAAVMASPGGWLETITKKRGIPFYPNLYLYNGLNPFKGIKVMRSIREAVRTFKPDMVSLHSSAAGFWGRVALRNNIPTLFTAHGWAFTQGAPLMRKIVAIIAEKITSRWCGAIVCVSANDRNLALKYHIAPRRKVVLIHNGVEIPHHKAHEPRHHGIRIVFVGRLSEPKRPIWLLEAYAELEKKVKDASKIHIIGEGEQREELEVYIHQHGLENSVILHGALPRSEVLEELDASDIFVLLSRYEGFPRSILEAMAAGLPVIASDVGGVREALSDDAGIIIKRGDKKALVTALGTLITHSEERIKMGERAYRRASKQFSLDEMMQKTYSLYKDTFSA